ncbi:unnamed protein product [Cylindrotheca closterium]|uniref:Cytidyltransferase-like domain-containing protein n=1 Tax=Cylindrotheca closterium TaxID=2856 RepID=A0AAD2PUA8_9STRA|nr:unnamed protein product [Cylindrotheca closterium]
MDANTATAATSSSAAAKPLTIGVFGGSFNPVHLGHALLAITTQQTKPVDQVVLVPVYKHAVKRNLLPFEDRVRMCQLAIASFGDALSVSTIEQEVGASNGAMLQALKKKYPEGTRFVWICGDDFIRWMHKPKGIETLQEVSGLILQRRLHKQTEDMIPGSENATSGAQNRFIQEPLDEEKLHRVAKQLNLEVDFIYGELPHFSSTLVRRAPGHWRSFLTQTVVQYLDERPHLLQQLIDDLEQEEQEQTQLAKRQKVSHRHHHKRTPSTLANLGKAGSFVLQGLDVVDALQLERGRTGLHLSTGAFQSELEQAQAATDSRLILRNNDPTEGLEEFDEVSSLAAELQRIPVWLGHDRRVLEKRSKALLGRGGIDGWVARLSLVEKFNSRIDVLIAATTRALVEILENHQKGNGGGGGGAVVPSNQSSSSTNQDIPELLGKWCDGKEALGRLRAFVCAAGPTAPQMVQSSLKMRQRLNQRIDTKDRSIAQVLDFEAGFSSKVSAPEALISLLHNVTLWEYKLMRCFASSTPLPVIHTFLNSLPSQDDVGSFDVEKFFDASTSAIDFLLSFAKALAASACATA